MTFGISWKEMSTRPMSAGNDVRHVPRMRTPWMRTTILPPTSL